MKLSSIKLLLLLPIFFWACGETIDGNGNIVTESRILNDFKEIRASGVYEIILEEGEPGIVIETDENLIPYIVTSVEGEKLVINTKDVFLNSDHLKLYVSYDKLEKIAASGALKLTSKNPIKSSRFNLDVSGAVDGNLEVNVDELNVEIAGGADLSVRGRARECNYAISGAAEIEAFDLIAEEVNIEISGAGEVDVTVSKKLSVDISGAADVNYKGSPKVSESVSGAGSITKVNE